MPIGRWLCRIGLHRWGFGTAVDFAPARYTTVTYACNRKRCSQPMVIVDTESRCTTH